MSLAHEYCADYVALAVLKFFNVPFELPRSRDAVLTVAADVSRSAHMGELSSFARRIIATIMLGRHETTKGEEWILEGLLDKTDMSAELPETPSYCYDAVAAMTPSYTPQSSAEETKTPVFPYRLTSSFLTT